MSLNFADLSELPEPEDAQRAFKPRIPLRGRLLDAVRRHLPGLRRTAMEVANWVFMTEEEKRAVWIRIKAQGYPGATIKAAGAAGLGHVT